MIELKKTIVDKEDNKMNRFERKLYNIIQEEEVVKNKKTGNVYVVQNFDPAKHDKPSPAEVEKAKQQNGGQLPKGEPQNKTPQAGAQKPNEKPVGQKLGGSDLKSKAEKPTAVFASDVLLYKARRPIAVFCVPVELL